MAESTPSTTQLIWAHDLRFEATVGAHPLIVDGNSKEGLSPMQLLAVGTAGCMAIDVISILQKGRHPVRGLRATVSSERQPSPPKRFVALTLHFDVTGNVPEDAVSRAIELSRTKYCSAWNSLREDITLTTGFTVTP
jgi:putative redox protein